jgi:hypothetical protein
MRYKQEIYARQLYQDLKYKFHGKQNVISKFLPFFRNIPNSDIEISIKGAGVNWECLVSKGKNYCHISCFDIDLKNVQYKGPEYYTSFGKNNTDVAKGRTFDKEKTIESVIIWLENGSAEALYARFDFVDQKKRALEKIKADVIKLNPKIIEATQKEVVKEWLSTYSLLFKEKNRSCRVYYYGYESNPRVQFNWDDCLILQASDLDIVRGGSLITKWVIDHEMPSVLAKEFPEVVFGKLAEFYEKGKGIEGEFLMSWDDIEEFYNTINLEQKKEIISLIKTMRNKGFDKTLRAGTSLYTLIISRSRRHGLRENQSNVSFTFNYIKSAMEVRPSGKDVLCFDKIEYNGSIEKLLKALEQVEID